MPKFFEKYLKTLSKKRKTELLNWWVSTSDRDIVLNLFEVVDPSGSKNKGIENEITKN